jgi:hypothetical protein
MRRGALGSVVLVVACSACGSAVTASNQPTQTVVVTTTVQPSALPMSTPSSSIPRPPPASVAVSRVNYARPESVAAAFLALARSLDWRWESPAGYLPRVRALSTPEYWSASLAPLAKANAGQSWLDFKNAHGVQIADVISAKLAPGAPRASSACVIRVEYRRTVSGDGDLAASGGNTSGAENLIMKRVGTRWLVSGISAVGG